MKFDEELDRLRSAVERLPNDKDLEVEIKWIILGFAKFIEDPKSRYIHMFSKDLSSYQDCWINFHKGEA